MRIAFVAASICFDRVRNHDWNDRSDEEEAAPAVLDASLRGDDPDSSERWIHGGEEGRMEWIPWEQLSLHLHFGWISRSPPR